MSRRPALTMPAARVWGTLALAIVLATGASARSPVGSAAPVLPARLALTLDPVIAAMWSAFDTSAAVGHVRFVSQYWRLPGNAGFDRSIDHVRARLLASGFTDGAAAPGAAASTRPRTWIESYPDPGHGWAYTVGTLAIARSGKPDQVVLSREGQQLALCINSFSTPASGVTARLVDVGDGGQVGDYAGKDVTGAVVLGDAGAGQLWRQAVTGHGAIGVVSTELGDYVNPNPPGAKATPRQTWNILQWGSVPYDNGRRGFGFKATPRAAATLRAALAAGPVNVHVTIASTFSDGPARTLVAEIPGRVTPGERVVITAHVQEPGASDNGSGIATLTELARALAGGIRRGVIPPPARTITFLWLDEIAGSRQWLTDHAADAKNVRYMFSMDMTGEDTRKTGGTFLIERYPDPGAVWDRPWDPHTEWGRGNVRASQLTGDLINDLHLAVCERVARRTGWVVRTNPYEGGSDHTVFGTAGIPAVLDWHFTDRYYHTNFDTADKVSGAEMRNVGVSVAVTAWLLASARAPSALAVADLVAAAGRARIALEEREGAKLAATDAHPTAARLREDEIVAAWQKWYVEAVRSVARLVVGPTSPGFDQHLDRLTADLEK
jgi:aminopeptidase YwaD